VADQVRHQAGDTAGEDPAAHVEDLLGLGQPARSGVGPGEPAGGGLDHQRAAGSQRADVGLGSRVLPHLGVHCRREHDRTPRGEQGIGQQIVGEPVRGLGQQIGGGRGDDYEIGVLADPDVWHLVGAGPDVGVDRTAGQRRPGGRADELQRRSSGYHGDVVAGFGK
jgi:hypothetical protein